MIKCATINNATRAFIWQRREAESTIKGDGREFNVRLKKEYPQVFKMRLLDFDGFIKVLPKFMVEAVAKECEYLFREMRVEQPMVQNYVDDETGTVYIIVPAVHLCYEVKEDMKAFFITSFNDTSNVGEMVRMYNTTRKPSRTYIRLDGGVASVTIMQAQKNRPKDSGSASIMPLSKVSDNLHPLLSQAVHDVINAVPMIDGKPVEFLILLTQKLDNLYLYSQERDLLISLSLIPSTIH